MKMGFSGTRDGMTDAQREAFRELVNRLAPTEFHHGDCVGADEQAAVIVHYARSFGVKIVCHPPADEAHRAFTRCNDESRPPLTHFARNRAIVDAAEALVACPREAERQPRGGTWYTHDYARKKGKPVYLVRPDGTVAGPDD